MRKYFGRVAELGILAATTKKAHIYVTRPSALGMSDPGVEPLEILELETPPYPRPPCRCPPCRLVR